jgi:hypothetical protein
VIVMERHTDSCAALSPRVRSILPFLAAAPSLCALLLSTLLLLVVAIGGRSRWLDNDMTMAEAAVSGDVGRVYRLLEAGQSPVATYSIRNDYRYGPTATMLAPIEAAVIGDNLAVLIVLIEHGGADDLKDRKAIYCLARKERKGDIEAWLEDHGVATQSDLGCP